MAKIRNGSGGNPESPTDLTAFPVGDSVMTRWHTKCFHLLRWTLELEANMRFKLTPIAFVSFTTCTACATVPSGSAGVVLGIGRVDPEPLGEGVHFVGPLAEVEIYDLRAQEKSEDLEALSADGMVLDAHASVMTFHPAQGEAVALAREIGPDYYRILVRPVVRSTLRQVLAAYPAADLDTPGITRAEREVTAETAQRLRPHHVVFDSISLRTLGITRSSQSYQAILDTGVKEQEAVAARLLPEQARQHADELRAEAQGIAESHALIAPTISPELLTDAANRAWTGLLTAPSTSVEVRPKTQPYVLEVEP
jgi:regulator of protease activity HflC (stomatin/prohibitin superfamily)